MLTTLRNLALLGLIIAYGASPSQATVMPDSACGECEGGCTWEGEDFGCNGAFSFCIIGECISYICADITDGMGVSCNKPE